MDKPVISSLPPVEVTRTGKDCLWELGGAWTNTGEATVIADAQGRPKQAIHVRTGGHLACAEHALIPVQAGDLVVRVVRHRGDFRIWVERIVRVGFYPLGTYDAHVTRRAACETVARFECGEWAPDPQEHMKAPIEAAVAKSEDYHCRSPFYVA